MGANCLQITHHQQRQIAKEDVGGNGTATSSSSPHLGAFISITPVAFGFSCEKNLARVREYVCEGKLPTLPEKQE